MNVEPFCSISILLPATNLTVAPGLINSFAGFLSPLFVPESTLSAITLKPLLLIALATVVAFTRLLPFSSLGSTTLPAGVLLFAGVGAVLTSNVVVLAATWVLAGFSAGSTGLPVTASICVPAG